jgi:hypothetical protein
MEIIILDLHSLWSNDKFSHINNCDHVYHAKCNKLHDLNRKLNNQYDGIICTNEKYLLVMLR